MAVTILCDHCGMQLSRRPSAVHNRNFCSQACCGKWQSQHWVGKNSPRYRGGPPTKLCPQCGEHFISYDSGQVCCSKVCSNKRRSRKVSLVCKNCSKIFERPQSFVYWHNIRGHKYFFCCMFCCSSFYVKEVHPRWKEDRGSIKNKKRTLRASKDMCEWRKQIYNRDNFTCQLCGNRSRKGNLVYLNAHHIQRVVDEPALALSISNGITLCDDCHKSTYGKEKIFASVFSDILTKKGRA